MPLTPKRRIDSEAASYQGAKQNQEYTHDLGLVALPVASAGPRHRVIRLHGGMGLRRAKFRFERGGRPPVVPAAANTAGDTLLSTAVWPVCQYNDQTKSYDWSMGGEYVYVQNAPRVCGVNAFPAGNLPFVPMGPAGRAAADLPGTLLSVGYPAADRADAQTEHLAANGYSAESSLFSPWPLPVFPAAYTSTHIIGG